MTFMMPFLWPVRDRTVFGKYGLYLRLYWRFTLETMWFIGTMGHVCPALYGLSPVYYMSFLGLQLFLLDPPWPLLSPGCLYHPVKPPFQPISSKTPFPGKTWGGLAGHSAMEPSMGHFTRPNPPVNPAICINCQTSNTRRINRKCF